MTVQTFLHYVRSWDLFPYNWFKILLYNVSETILTLTHFLPTRFINYIFFSSSFLFSLILSSHSFHCHSLQTSSFHFPPLSFSLPFYAFLYVFMHSLIYQYLLKENPNFSFVSSSSSFPSPPRVRIFTFFSGIIKAGIHLWNIIGHFVNAPHAC